MTRDSGGGLHLRSILFAAVVGLAGVGVLVALGIWQLQRLAWKEELIARIEAVMTDAPAALPAAPDPRRDRYRAIALSGHFTGRQTRVLTSVPDRGPGYSLIAAFATGDGRVILLERGYIPDLVAVPPPPPAGELRVTGNLDWPDDLTPGMEAHDAARDIWIGHDLPGLAAQLDALPLLVIARTATGDDITPVPVTAALRNDHLGYAITWFGLALAWAGMTGAWLWRIRAGRS